MEKKIVFRVTPCLVVLLLPLLYVDLQWGNNLYFDQRFRVEPEVWTNRIVEEKRETRESLDSILSRLVKDEDLPQFKSTGFACNSEVHSIHCVAGKPVRVHTGNMTVFLPFNDSPAPAPETVIRPYARQEDEILLKSVTPVRIIQGNITSLPTCDFTHDVPAVIFSTGGFVGNVFHEINELIIPLFITTTKFNSRVKLVLTDYNPKFVSKYQKILTRLTSHEIINPGSNQTVHCFPAAIVGLKFHGHLSLNSTEIPKSLSMHRFRNFLHQSLNLNYSHVSQIRAPTAVLLSRRTSRRIVNEDEVVGMMRELGFRVIVVTRAKTISNLTKIAGLINSCSVFVSTHGAGLTNEVFLPNGAVMVQVDLIGLDWAGATYYGNPARAMGVRYLRYKIEAEESSLFKIFGKKDHVAFTDPKRAFPVQAGREVYLNGQNVIINITRFRATMVEAMSLVRDTPL